MTKHGAVRTSRVGLGEHLADYLDRPTGGLTGPAGRAASATQAFLVFSLLLTAGYAVFFAIYDLADFRPNVISALVAISLFGLGLVLVSRGRQLPSAVIAVLVGTAQVAFVTTYLGWIAGFQLYLIAGGQLVFMLFTDRQSLLRSCYVAVAVGSFVYCQLLVPEHGWGTALADGASAVMFSINATVTVLLVFLLAAASHAGAVRARSEADGAAARAEYLANTDELTGLSNRRPVLRRLAELSSRSPYIVAIGDLDHFKRLNDTFGHDCGDVVLAEVGRRLREGLRDSDSVGRWGGEEFIVVMERATLADAVDTVERVRANLAEPMPCMGHAHETTMSFGLTDANPDGMPSLALQRADAALYEAKAAGRNAVHVVRGSAPAPRPVTPSSRRQDS
ncbi:GGDEF domain-containing protein [Demequina sp.]|uniref:GGDEF domain-containing protein n=1 Tax=Demequina sp. TaxID=2050685 RepID=UPI003D13D77A